MPRQVFVLVQITRHGDGFDIVAVYDDYEAAHAEARLLGVDGCRVLATNLR